jgi:SulP family sulfate permease
VPSIDATGLHTLDELVDAMRRRGITLIISAANQGVRRAMERSGFTERLGNENFCEDIFCALDRARALIAKNDSKQ